MLQRKRDKRFQHGEASRRPDLICHCYFYRSISRSPFTSHPNTPRGRLPHAAQDWIETGFKNLAEAEVQNTPTPKRQEVAEVSESVGVDTLASRKSSEEAFDTARTQLIAATGITTGWETTLNTVGRGQMEGYLYFGTGNDLYGQRPPSPDSLLATQDFRHMLRTVEFKRETGADRPVVPGKDTPEKKADIGDSRERILQFLTRLDAGERPSRVDLQNIGDTLSTLNSAQIAELRQRLEKDGGPKLDALKDDPRIPESHRAAFGIYLKGNNERSSEDIATLGNNALKHRDFTLFTQAMRDASPQAREAFRQSLPPDRLKEIFGKTEAGGDYLHGGPTELRYLETRESRLAEDLMKYGEVSLPNLIKEQTGILPTSREALKAAIDGISPGQQKLILDGEKISFDVRSGRKTSLTPEEQRSYELYIKTKEALTNATNPTEAYKWLDYLDGGGTRLISNLAGHRGTLYNSSEAAIHNELNNISPADWARGRNDHIYHQRTLDMLDTLHASGLSLFSPRDGFATSAQILAQKFDRRIETFDGSRTATEQVLSSIKFEGGKTFPDELSVLRSLSGIDKGSIERYGASPAFREQLDSAVRAAMRSDAGKAVAERFLKDLSDGKRPELSLKEKVSLFTENRLAMIDPDRQRALLNDIKEEMRKDPTLAKRLLNPGPEDRALVESLREAFPTVRADFFGTAFRPMPMQPKDGTINLFDAYVRPLAETGRLSLRVEASLGTHDRLAFTRSIADAPESERNELLSDRRMQHNFFAYWKQEERDIAMRTARTGDVEPRDGLHLAILSGDKAKVEQQLASVNPLLKPLLIESYKGTYGDINQQLEQNFKGRELFDLKTEVLDIPEKARAAFGLSRDQYYRSRDGLFAAFVHSFSGTGLLADNAHHRFATRISESARHFAELPQAEKDKLFKNARESLRQFIESKDATADVLVDTAITVATLPGTGGTSALLRAALLAAAARPSGKHLLLGDDHSGHYGRDAALGATIGLFNKLGPAQVSRLLGAGEEVATTASTVIAGRGLVPEANTGAFVTAMKQLVEDSMRRGGNINGEKLDQLARAFAVPGSSELLKTTIQNEIKRASESTLGKFLQRELAPNGLSAGTGAGVTQLAEGVLDDRPTSETLSRALTSFAFAFALGAGSTAALRSPHLLRETGRGDAADEILKRAFASPEITRPAPPGIGNHIGILRPDVKGASPAFIELVQRQIDALPPSIRQLVEQHGYNIKVVGTVRDYSSDPAWLKEAARGNPGKTHEDIRGGFVRGKDIVFVERSATTGESVGENFVPRLFAHELGHAIDSAGLAELLRRPEFLANAARYRQEGISAISQLPEFGREMTKDLIHLSKVLSTLSPEDRAAALKRLDYFLSDKGYVLSRLGIDNVGTHKFTPVAPHERHANGLPVNPHHRHASGRDEAFADLHHALLNQDEQLLKLLPNSAKFIREKVLGWTHAELEKFTPEALKSSGFAEVAKVDNMMFLESSDKASYARFTDGRLSGWKKGRSEYEFSYDATGQLSKILDGNSGVSYERTGGAWYRIGTGSASTEVIQPPEVVFANGVVRVFLGAQQ